MLNRFVQFITRTNEPIVPLYTGHPRGYNPPLVGFEVKDFAKHVPRRPAFCAEGALKIAQRFNAGNPGHEKH